MYCGSNLFNFSAILSNKTTYISGKFYNSRYASKKNHNNCDNGVV
jgi:hypothetical protein